MLKEFVSLSGEARRKQPLYISLHIVINDTLHPEQTK